MHELAVAIARILRKDRRYSMDAYLFVSEALEYAHTVLQMGTARPDLDDESETDEDDDDFGRSGRDCSRMQRHLTGQELCEAIRLYALEQYGYMAKCVLNSWGVRKTADFGDIVFNLIRVGHMRKTPEDKREDFDDNFDFETGLQQSFKIVMPE